MLLLILDYKRCCGFLFVHFLSLLDHSLWMKPAAMLGGTLERMWWGQLFNYNKSQVIPSARKPVQSAQFSFPIRPWIDTSYLQNKPLKK